MADAESDLGAKTALAGKIVYQFMLIAPFLPTYLHLITSALFPIFTGAHASLSRPSSAAKAVKKKRRHGEPAETTQKMEGLSPSDALLYPLFTGCMLAGLYFLIKWLQNPDILNLILNAYLSIFGIFAIAKLLSDSMTTLRSFVFPAKFLDGGLVWQLSSSGSSFEPVPTGALTLAGAPGPRPSPLPGALSRISLPAPLRRALWALRRTPSQPLGVLKANARGLGAISLRITPQGILSSALALVGVAYFNLVDRPWWLTNLLGFSFCYSALQMMSPTTFWTGTLVLMALFFYDVYFVFFTPMMITVATQLDIPVKLLFPRPAGEGDDAAKKALAMLGLGDIVLPGIMIGLALRFDLFVFYLKKQRQRLEEKADEVPASATDVKPSVSPVTALEERPLGALVYGKDGIGKVRYVSATGNWGERFWLGVAKHAAEGSSFPKPYFYASIVGYILGMLTTVSVMHVFKHGQPALLYLVPGVLLSLWGTAFFRGEVKMMWDYMELDEEEAKEKEKEEEAKKKTKENNDATDGKENKSSDSSSPDEKKSGDDNADEPKTDASKPDVEDKSKTSKENKSFFSFSFKTRDLDSDDTPAEVTLGDKPKKGLKRISHGPVGAIDDSEEEDEEEEDSDVVSGSGSPSSAEFVVSAKKAQDEPGMKRRRVA